MGGCGTARVRMACAGRSEGGAECVLILQVAGAIRAEAAWFVLSNKHWSTFYWR